MTLHRGPFIGVDLCGKDNDAAIVGIRYDEYMKLVSARDEASKSCRLIFPLLMLVCVFMTTSILFYCRASDARSKMQAAERCR